MTIRNRIYLLIHIILTKISQDLSIEVLINDQGFFLLSDNSGHINRRLSNISVELYNVCNDSLLMQTSEYGVNFIEDGDNIIYSHTFKYDELLEDNMASIALKETDIIMMKIQPYMNVFR